MLFTRARGCGASGLLLAHNHPSNACRPSAADIAATARLRVAARAWGLVLVDHLIVTRHAVFSMREGAIR